MDIQKSAEGIVGLMFDLTEGPNMLAVAGEIEVYGYGEAEDGHYRSCRQRR